MAQIDQSKNDEMSAKKISIFAIEPSMIAILSSTLTTNRYIGLAKIMVR